MATPKTDMSGTVTHIDANTIREAHERIKPRIHHTPVLTSQSLNSMAGAELFFKCENLQKTGSLKITFCESVVPDRNQGTTKIQTETGATMVLPYADVHIIAGQATAAKELLE